MARSNYGIIGLVGTLVAGCGDAGAVQSDAGRFGDAGQFDAGPSAGEAGSPHDAGADAGDAGRTFDQDASAGPAAPTLPPANAAFDYQLGGAYTPPSGVQVVARDRTEPAAVGLYNVCYVNGFQVQPGEEDAWAPDLILRDEQGDPVIDPDWDELLLDVSTSEKRGRIAAVLTEWFDGCAEAGFEAVEIDNLDTYARSGGRIAQDHAVALMQQLSTYAHGIGLAIAQKNSTELLARRAELGTDFAVAEECSRYDECGEYVAAYGDHILMIEYRAGDFEAGCAAYGASHSIVLRDLELVPAGQSGYVFEGC